MLRIHFIQEWFDLSHRATQEALHDVPQNFQFARLGCGMSRLAGERTVFRFCPML